MHLVSPQNICITIASNFSWVLKPMVMHIIIIIFFWWGGGGAKQGALWSMYVCRLVERK